MKRMQILLLILPVLIICSIDTVHATKVEIPLPQLSGTYDQPNYWPTRQATFRFDRLPIDISGVSIKLQGFFDPGQWYCEYGEPYPIPVAWPIRFLATMSDSVTGGVWRAEHVIYGLNWGVDLSSFDFVATVAFLPQDGASWDFLRAGRGALFLNAKPITMGGGWGCHNVYPQAIVYIATLIVDADYQIDTEQYTWGSIKALFSR
jgi:hypothetical protein